MQLHCSRCAELAQTSSKLQVRSAANTGCSRGPGRSSVPTRELFEHYFTVRLTMAVRMATPELAVKVRGNVP